MLDPEGHKEKTKRNREFAPRYLKRNGIRFESKNNGAHLIIPVEELGAGRVVNFWPGTGLFHGPFRDTKMLKGRGIHNLVKILKGKKPWKEYRTD